MSTAVRREEGTGITQTGSTVRLSTTRMCSRDSTRAPPVGCISCYYTSRADGQVGNVRRRSVQRKQLWYSKSLADTTSKRNKQHATRNNSRDCDHHATGHLNAGAASSAGRCVSREGLGGVQSWLLPVRHVAHHACLLLQHEVSKHHIGDELHTSDGRQQ